MTPINRKSTLLYLLLVSTVLLLGTVVEGADEENCLMCHKYRFIGRIDENGKRHNYNVDEATYNRSVHRSVSCRDCHTYITKIPHDPVTEQVNCANKCHIRPPFSQEQFSHEKIINIYNQSIHGIRPGDSDLERKAKPYCKYCHLNPLYSKISEKLVAYEETLRRCFNCHTEQGVIQAYRHITHRLRKKTSRSPQEIVALCSKCHHDVALMKKLNVSERALEAVDTYNRSIHGKLVRLGSQKAADCISCHASNALHDIFRKDNKLATINSDNIIKTCNQCHKNATSWFIQVAVHPTEHSKNPFIHVVSIGLRFAIYGSVLSLVGLMLLETFGRKKDGIRFLLKNGTSWRRKSKDRTRK